MSNNPQTYISLSEYYLQDYLDLIYKKYPSFQNVMYVDFYSLDASTSSYDENLKNFYKNVNDQNYGGKFNRILNFPIMTSTNNIYDNEAGEKGIKTQHTSEINFTVDPTIPIIIKPEDIVRFNISKDYFGFYKITNVDDSATFNNTYKKVTAQLIAGLTQNKLNSFVIGECVFIQEYHKIYDRELAILILNLGNKINESIADVNSHFKSNLDFHIFDDNETIVTSYERAFNQMLKKYDGLITLENLKRSYSYNSNFYNTEPTTIFDMLINPYDIEDYTYYKRVQQLTDFNSLRETNQLNSHKYFAADTRQQEIEYFNSYTAASDYTCTCSIISPDSDIAKFWEMYEKWLSALKNKDVTLFTNDTVNYDQTIYKLMLGWLEILASDKMILNQKEYTINYFNSFTDSTLFVKTVLLSQMLYLQNNFKSCNTIPAVRTICK